jgi:biotin carboxylase
MVKKRWTNTRPNNCWLNMACLLQRRLASTKAEALDAARKIGYPVALKACSWEIMHKSGKGLIALNIENATQLKDNFQSIQKAAGNPCRCWFRKCSPETGNFWPA